MAGGGKLYLILSALFILETVIYAKNMTLLRNISKGKGFADAESYFAIDMYKKYLIVRRLNAKVNDKSDQSFSIPPLSITGAFLVLQDGLKEDRGVDEIWMFLGYERSKINSEDAHAEYTKFLNKEQLRTSLPPHYILEIGNFIISDTSLSLLKEYQTKMEKNYNATVKEEVFPGNERALVKEMNSWVEDKTRNSIHNMIDHLKSQTKLMILSTAFFMGTWENEFNPKLTRNAQFLCGNGQSKIVRMMQAEGRAEYYTENDEYFALELHLNGDRARFFILCAKDPGRQYKLEEKLTFQQMVEIRKKMTRQNIRTLLPKVKIQFKRKLRDAASDLLLSKIFDPDATSFGGMTVKDYMFVSEVYHSAVIDISEKFVNASGAATIAVSRNPDKRRRRSRVRRKCTTRTLTSSSSGCFSFYSDKGDNASSRHFSPASILDENDLKSIYDRNDTTWLSNNTGCLRNQDNTPHMLAESRIKEVKIDRPFLLAILQSDHDMIWFMGRIFECPKS